MTPRKSTLVSLLVTLFLLTVMITPALAGDNLEQQVVQQINQARAEKNIPQLQLDATLTSAAGEQAKKIANSYKTNYDILYRLSGSGQYKTIRMQILRSSNIASLIKYQLNNGYAAALQQQYDIAGIGIEDSKNFGQVGVLLFAKSKNTEPQQTEQPKPEQPNTPEPTTPEPTTPEQHKPPVENNQSAANISEFQQKVVALVNQERAKAGLQPLVIKTDLTNVAQIKAEDMAQNKYFSHTSPTYGSPFDMMKKFGINYTRAGENIAMGYTTPESVMEGWMNSPGHKQNILNPNFKEIGVGFTPNGNYWVQMFATR